MPVTNQWTSKTICAVLLVTMAVGVLTLSGPNVCMVQQKYNITKRVKYRAPMSIRTYEWCFSMPPRCSKWSTEMRDLTRLETEERTAEVAVCCPGYKMKDVSCVAICPNGKTGHGCTEDCPPNKWGPNCVNECGECINGYCLPTTGECDCEDGWQGESCQISMPTTQPPPALMEELLTTTKSSVRTVPSALSTIPTVKTKSFTSPIHTLTSTPTSKTTLPTKMTLSTTKKTETTSNISTLINTKTTSVPLYNNISLTYITPMWAETNTTIELPKITNANFVYNRTETPVEGTSVKLISKHDRSPQMKIPITVKPEKIPFRLNSTVSSQVNESTVFLSTTMPRSPIITSISTTTTKPNTTTIYMTTDINSNVNSSITTILTTTTIPSTTFSTTSTTHFAEPPSTSFTVPFKIPSTTPIKTSFTTPPTISSTPTTTTIVPRPTIHDTATVSTFLPPNINIPIVTTNQKPIITSTSTTALPTPSVIATNLSTSMTKITIIKEVTEKDMTLEYTRKPEILNYNLSTTVKFKPKEIWIKPTQKGESTFESKLKNIHDVYNKHKTVTNKNEAVSENTTPKTIIVSIIPTSVSHATFKKIALTTAAYVYQKKNVTLKLPSKINKGFTKSMTSQVSTAMPFTIKILPTLKAKTLGTYKSTTQLSQDTTRMLTPTSKKALLHSTVPEKQTSKVLNTTIATSRTTNSMSTLNEDKNLTSPILTIKPQTNKDKHITRTSEITTISNKNIQPPFAKDEAGNNTIKVNITRSKAKLQETAIKILNEKANSKNITKISNKVTTQEPEHETFHILTEPEHITAVMSDRDRDQTSMDLISVISIAGGVMMTIITVAIIIVMIERCKRPRYDEVRKMNDIRMQVMIDNNDVPPPYVRSIFHAPLPDPPHSDRCHYQPISTLDRNLKQFMRPVVVQSISPVMLENFRGILECHYDHLPRRNHDFGTMPARGPVSMKPEERRPLSVADYTIEALKCEAKLDVIDNTTSEPLYAEIPCWRPPSEHAIAVVNLNGEAITEL